MNPSNFWPSYFEAITFLKTINLLKDSNPHNYRPYSDNCKNYSRSEDYFTIYKALGDNGDYDIILNDNSYFQLNIENRESRLMFIQCPTQFVSFEDFLNDIFGESLKSEHIAEWRDLYDSDYNQFLSEQETNKGAVYMRYDVDSKGRENNENIHAYTHLHIGLNNKIRIPVGIEFTPLTFVMFVVRNVYYDVWAKAIKNNTINKYYDAKAFCGTLDKQLWTDEEKKFPYIC